MKRKYYFRGNIFRSSPLRNPTKNMDIFIVVIRGDLESLKKLVSEGSNVEIEDDWGRTPLIYASKNGRLEIMKYLIEECNANVEAKDKLGYTPLMRASMYDHFEIVKYLIEEHNANVEAKSNNGNTPLMWASELSRLEIVKYFIENRANYEELLERLEKEGDIKRRDQLEKIILEVADSRIKFITSDKY